MENIHLEKIFDVGDTYYGHFFDYNDDSTFVVGEDHVEDVMDQKGKDGIIYSVTNDGYVKYRNNPKFIGRFHTTDAGKWEFCDMVDQRKIRGSSSDLLQVEREVFAKLLEENIDWSYVWR